MSHFTLDGLIGAAVLTSLAEIKDRVVSMLAIFSSAMAIRSRYSLVFIQSVVYQVAMTNKPFDQKLFDENDNAAREKTKHLFSLYRPTEQVIDNPDIYAQDLVIVGKGFIEVEVKHNWGKGRFPFDSLHISYRKEKFVDGVTNFVIWSSNLLACAIVSPETMRIAYVVEKDTKLTKNELFYEIHKDLPYWVYL